MKDFEPLRAFCAALPAATEDIKWGADLCYSVGAKMFAVFGIEQGATTSFCCKVDPDRFLELTDQPGVEPAPYLARAHWVLVRDPGALPLDTLKELATRSHGLVAAGLTKKLQRSLGLLA